MAFHAVVAAFLALLWLSASTVAQPLGTDLLVASGGSAPAISRVSQGGVAMTILTSPGSIMVTVDTDNYHIVSVGGSAVHRVDPVARSVVATVWSGAPLVSLRSIWVDQDGDYLVTDLSAQAVFKVRRDGSAISTFFSNPVSFAHMAEEKNSADWMIGYCRNSNNRCGFFRVDRTTMAILSTLEPPNALDWWVGLRQDPHVRDLYISRSNNSTGELLRYDPILRRMTTINTATPPGGVVLTVDRAPRGDGALVYLCSFSTVHRYDRAGTALGVVSGIPSIINGLAFDRSRNLGPELVTPPNDRIIKLSFPGEAGKPYVLALGLSGYTPGIPLPDGRVIPLNPDALTTLTVRQSIPPLLGRNIGFLSATSIGTVTFNANGFGSVLQGVRVWAAAVVLDPAAPFGIDQISAPLVFVL